MKELGDARQQIAAFFNVKPMEVLFTSGATESLNMIIKGFFEKSPGGHVITTNVEHACVDRCMQWAEKKGVEVTYLQVGRYGAATPEMVRAAIKPNTRLIVTLACNNETGVLTDIEGIAAIAQEAGIPFVVDGVALLGKQRVTLPAGVSAICFSGHKIHGPKGIGVAIVRKKLVIEPLILGGDHEFGRRAGTQNLPGIVGIAKAMALLNEDLPGAVARMTELRDKLKSGLCARISDLKINGEGPRVCNTLNVQFPGVDGEALLALLDREGVAVSHGSACASGALQPSRILINMGLTHEEASASVRISLSRMTTAAEVDRFIELVSSLLHKLR
jgi:cysteine desulfurase